MDTPCPIGGTLNGCVTCGLEELNPLPPPGRTQLLTERVFEEPLPKTPPVRIPPSHPHEKRFLPQRFVVWTVALGILAFVFLPPSLKMIPFILVLLTLMAVVVTKVFGRLEQDPDEPTPDDEDPRQY